MLVPKLRFKEFESKYVEYKLKDIVDFYKGNILSKSDIAVDGKIPCILYGELYTKYSEITKFIISHTNNKSENLFYSRVNDVLIPCSGETALDISTSTCVLLDNVALGGDLNVLRPKKYIDGKYLSYLLSNKKRITIAKYAQGDSIVHLYADKIKNISIILPSLDEQQKVSFLLELLNKKIELQQKKIEALKMYKKGLLQKILNLGEDKRKISEILEEVIEKSTENNQYDVISSTKDCLILQKEYFNRSIASENNAGYKILKKNQIVLSPQNLWMGNINYNDKYNIGIVSPSYKVFDIKEGYSKEYIASLLKTNRALYMYKISSEQGASIVRRNLNIEAFYEITFKIPTLKEQIKYGNIIKEVNKKIDNMSNISNKLLDLKKGLLQKMFI